MQQMLWPCFLRSESSHKAIIAFPILYSINSCFIHSSPTLIHLIVDMGMLKSNQTVVTVNRVVFHDGIQYRKRQGSSIVLVYCLI